MKSAAILSGLLLTMLFPTIGVAANPNWRGQPLTWEDDLASKMIAGIDKFLIRKTTEAVEHRHQQWNYDTSSLDAYNASIQPHRERLAHILGLRDERMKLSLEEWQVIFNQKRKIASGPNYSVYQVRWPVLPDPDPNRHAIASMTAEGLLLLPDDEPVANVIVVPHADQTPEMFAGLAAGLDNSAQYARHLAQLNCRVLVPTLLSYEMKPRNGRANLSNREYVHRSAFELGRHIIGYELQKIIVGIDYFQALNQQRDRPLKTGLFGFGEGGLLTLYTSALDTRIDVVGIAGFRHPLEQTWQQPVNRNVFGLLEEFGTAELTLMLMSRDVHWIDGGYQEITLPSEGGAPGQLTVPTEQDRLQISQATGKLLSQLGSPSPDLSLAINMTQENETRFDCYQISLQAFIQDLKESLIIEIQTIQDVCQSAPPVPTAPLPDASARQQRQLEEIDRHNQLLLREAPFARKEFMKDLDTSSLEAYNKSIERYRDIFRQEVIGEFEQARLPLNPRTRIKYETEDYTGYEVVLDVFPDVFAYGILLVPTDINNGEQRPVVVCQHGLEGRPTDTIENDHRAYHNYAAELASRGFVVFAPQNPYIFKDRFRTLQRKANPLGKTLFSIIVPQHEAITDWLAALPFVDESRIGFYGLSYGGKSAMRIPALVDRYCLSICSADFNEWVLKNASSRHKYSYVWTGEYEIFEWDLGSTFNYAEMAALIAPRPFMVERGHFDGVAPDEWVGYEFAKVRNLYQARLGIGDRCELEWFVGPHTIHGQGTFRFLSKHLNWPIDHVLGE